MKCILLCVFHEELESVFVLLESLFLYGELDSCDCRVFIYTTSVYRDRLRQSHLCNDSVVFGIQDVQTGNERFDMSVVSSYESVLYLDVNCVVKGPLSPLFEKAQKDRMMVLEEDGIHYFNHLGENLYFICPIFLYQPGPILEDLLRELYTGQDKRYTVCTKAVYNQLDHSLHPFAICHNENLYDDKPIHYSYASASFLNHLKEDTIQVHLQEAKLFILKHLLPLIHRSGELLEGNIFMEHHTTRFSDLFLDKQRNISNLVLNRQVTKAMEIGFNSGFSALLMLLSNPGLSITCFDLGEHRYTRPCYEKLKEHFGSRIQLIVGDSMETLPRVEDTFQLIHIDGGHATDVATSDIVQSYRLSKPGTILIMDDYDFPNLHQLWDGYICSYQLRPLDLRVYPSPHHDIRQV